MHVSGGEISWHLFYKVYEDQQVQANLKAAPKVTACVLHPVAFAIFHPSTSAAIKNYFPERDDAATLSQSPNWKRYRTR